MRTPLRAIACAVLATTVASAARAQDIAPDTFPHARHAKVFPTCTGCHTGIRTGDLQRTFPSPTVCAGCHDGTIQRRVNWTPRPVRSGGLLAFSHPAHIAASNTAADSAAAAARRVDDAVTCVRCHAPDTTTWMSVRLPVQDVCRSCHTHAAPAHLADESKCAKCHRPLASAPGVAESRVLELPRPESHSHANWVSTHGALAKRPQANCIICHARESCARCHVNAAISPVILALGNDARVARANAGRPPSYPIPASHRTANWGVTHSNAARTSTAYCATCHARASCETCHVGAGADSILRQLPDSQNATAPGVQLRHVPNRKVYTNVAQTEMSLAAYPHARDTVPHQVRVHPPDWAHSHGPSAASGELNCTSCHARTFCSECHTAERTTRRYHPANFVATHPPQAYGRESDCATCHSTEAFCRSCHMQAGLAPRAPTSRTTTFHNAQPLWLLKHGRAARQDLPSCTTCHQQSYCMQCHSQSGARINPHGPGFDAARMSSRNPQMCARCHVTSPLKP